MKSQLVAPGQMIQQEQQERQKQLERLEQDIKILIKVLQPSRPLFNGEFTGSAEFNALVVHVYRSWREDPVLRGKLTGKFLRDYKTVKDDLELKLRLGDVVVRADTSLPYLLLDRNKEPGIDERAFQVQLVLATMLGIFQASAEVTEKEFELMGVGSREQIRAFLKVIESTGYIKKGEEREVKVVGEELETAVSWKVVDGEGLQRLLADIEAFLTEKGKQEGTSS